MQKAEKRQAGEGEAEAEAEAMDLEPTAADHLRYKFTLRAPHKIRSFDFSPTANQVKARLDRERE
jgi:hypothetical protein